MTLEQFLKTRLERLASEKSVRSRCYECRKPQATCYCAQIKPFESDPRFVILIHRDEARRSVATGRMAHRCLSNSYFFEGLDFTDHAPLNAVLEDKNNHCVLLYPGKESVEITRKSAPIYYQKIPKRKRLVVIVIDGTWAQARRMRRLSLNLKRIPEISFSPETPSLFLVRQQPAENCYSTIEAIHTIIDWMNPDPIRQHENLLESFAYMVNQQVGYEMHYGALRGFRPTRGHRESVSK